MANRYSTARTSGGTRLQSGIPKGDPKNNVLRAHGLSLQGVVVAVYVYDGDGPSQTGLDGVVQNTIYVDVLCYGKHEGVIPRVLWTMERQGLHEGEISIPRAATIGLNESLDTLQTNPTNMDGDHVIVNFLEDNLQRPYVSRSIPHPSSDVGNDAKLIGHRTRLKGADKDPRFWKHKGVFWGVDKDGNAVMDLTRAHAGTYMADGKEPEPAVDGAAGNYKIRLPQASKLTIEVTKGAQVGDGSDAATESTTMVLENNKLTIMNEGGAGVLIQNKDGDAIFTLGDGAVHTTIAEHMQTLWDQLVQYLTAATVLTALGPSSPIPLLSGPPPPWDPAINSTKHAFPDG